jgi:AraC-like DNA-binding protein
MLTHAYGKDYFGNNGFPLTVKVIKESPWRQHEHDLTEIEHTHDFSELVVITGGYGIHRVEELEYPVSAGDAFLIQGKKRHFFSSRHNLELYNVMYDQEKLPLPLELLNKIPGYHAMFILEPDITTTTFNSRLHLDRATLSKSFEILKSMEKESLNKSPGYEARLLALLLELMVYLARKYSTTRSNDGKALLKTSKVINLLEAKFSHNWNLGEIAGQVGMSKSNLLLTFKKATGQSPIDYLIQLRVQKAMEMLRSTDEPISDIAFATGFSDSNYFSRQFRKINGNSPRTYRNSAKK